ncbi:nuclear apoptosis-inducing factor 1-like [Labeo rohita]|uniref:nuclear apoptosis-inducing factor 1-like n=1 Tax=Labeo rohita TaxID=84645 RepID=UPI0021E2BA89|nr:nuclear apoptosis-inducing factor 1-like [Labeo rohita]
MASKKKRKKSNYSEAEIDVLLMELQMRGKVLFGSLSGGGGKQRTLPEVKKKWADLKLQSKKRIAAHMAKVRLTGGGGPTCKLSPEDERICAIIGEGAVKGIYEEGDTDLLSAEGSEDEGSLQRRAGHCSRTASLTAAAPAISAPEAASSSHSRPLRPPAASSPSHRARLRPSTSSSTRGSVLSEAVLQTQRDLNQSVSEVVTELRQVRHALVEMNQTLSAIAGTWNKLLK